MEQFCSSCQEDRKPLGLEEAVLCPEGMERRSEAVGFSLPHQTRDQTEDVAAGAQLRTPPTQPSIFVCSTNRLPGIFLRL